MKNKIDLRGTLHAYDWLKGIRYQPKEEEIVQVLFKNTRSGFYRNPEGLPLKQGDWVAVEAAPGHDIGKVMLCGPLVGRQMKKANVAPDAELKKIFRIASEADIEKFRLARAREHETMIRSRQIAADLGLNMKIGDVEYQGDGGKAIFYYIADERVDFRKLIRILADTFKIRIEMKQIGARQEAGRIGGIGPCGRPLCCSSWMSRFVSVGTGAARVQDLSMNPQKLAGQCAKLKCCLNFETDAYAEASRQLPPKDAVLLTQDGEFYQFKVDILARKITYSTDKHLAANLVTISAARAFEIIALNKQGVKVEQLEAEKPQPNSTTEYVEIVGQDSLTRFDKSKQKKRKGQKQRAAAGQPSQQSAQQRRNPEHNQERNKERNQERDQERNKERNQERNKERNKERGRQTGRGEKPRGGSPKEKHARHQKSAAQSDHTEEPKQGKHSAGERAERPERTERPERAERAERQERPERAEHPERQQNRRRRQPNKGGNGGGSNSGNPRETQGKSSKQ